MQKCVAWFGMAMVLAFAGCATAPREPRNLSDLKAEILRYVDSGEYARQIVPVAEEAGAWIEQRAARRTAGEKLAVIFDVDETLLSNLPSMVREDFGYVPKVWDAWVNEARAPAIEPVREVYLSARRLGIAVFLITGRGENVREGTERNLRAEGCREYVALICKPVGETRTSGEFKLAERRRIVAEGYVIVANIGDQESDFFGGVSERNFKLPGPFYRAQ